MQKPPIKLKKAPPDAENGLPLVLKTSGAKKGNDDRSLVWYDVTDRIFAAVTLYLRVRNTKSMLGRTDPLGKYSEFRKECIRMKRIIPVIVALLLIVIIGGVYFGRQLVDKYSYGKETADLDEYYRVTNGRLAIILQDEMLTEQAVVKDDAIYFDLNTVYQYFNDGFYVDYNEQKLLYTTAVDTTTAMFGQTGYTSGAGDKQTTYTVCYMDEGVLYVAAEYVKLFTNYEYFWYDRHLQVYTEWGIKETMTVSKDTQVRILGGIKSKILRELEQGEVVELLEQMDTWSLVKTSDSVIGYVENKRLTNLSTEIETPVTDYAEPEHTMLSVEGKLSLGWHAIYSSGGGSASLNDRLEECKVSGGGYSINVIAPTWFSLSDSYGGFRSYAEKGYVQTAHDRGLQVWGVWDNFNYAADVQGAEVNTYQVLSDTAVRQKLAADIVSTSLELELDGVNIDFENMAQDCGEHFVQFVRELSVLCQESGLALSVDNPVPFNFNGYYRLDIQGKFADYVIIMGYDEHWGGSGDPGSVASIGYVSDGLDRTLEQVPAEKVINALPFYCRLWRTEGTEVTDAAITLKNVAGYLDNAVWDEETSQYYAEWKEGDAIYQIWIENEESLRVKLNVMNAKKLGGVAVWRLEYGTPTAWELIQNYVNS